jgi:predicted permease
VAEFFNAVSAVFVIFLIQSVGYLLGHLGWLTDNEKKFISKYVINMAVPVNCVVGMLKNFSREDLLKAGVPLLIGITVVGASLLLGAVVATALKLPRNRWGVFVAMAGISNSMFIGLPVTQQLFGPPSLPYMMMYFLASSLYTQTVAVVLCEQAGTKGSSGKPNFLKMAMGMFKKPPVIGIMTAVVLLLTGLRPPQVILNAAGYISNTVTPLALIYCGFILYEVGIKNLRLMPGLPTMLVIRLVLSPILCIGMSALFGITGLARDVFVIMASLPCVTQITVMAGLYGADEQYAAVGSSLSLLGMFVTLPILMAIL